MLPVKSPTINTLPRWKNMGWIIIIQLGRFRRDWTWSWLKTNVEEVSSGLPRAGGGGGPIPRLTQGLEGIITPFYTQKGLWSLWMTTLANKKISTDCETWSNLNKLILKESRYKIWGCSHLFRCKIGGKDLGVLVDQKVSLSPCGVIRLSEKLMQSQAMIM